MWASLRKRVETELASLLHLDPMVLDMLSSGTCIFTHAYVKLVQNLESSTS